MSGVTLRELAPSLADMIRLGGGSGTGNGEVLNVVVSDFAHISNNEPKEVEGNETPLIWYDIVD